MKVVKTLATSTSSNPTYYDEVLYDVVYYDKWVGDTTQGETPLLNVDSKNVRMNIQGDIPRIKIKNE